MTFSIEGLVLCHQLTFNWSIELKIWPKVRNLPLRMLTAVVQRVGKILAIAIFSTVVARASMPVSIERNLSIMGTYIHIEVKAINRERALAVSDRVIAEIERADHELSTWKVDSTVSKINSLNIGSSLQINSYLAGEFREAMNCQRSTSGNFNPLLGQLTNEKKRHQSVRSDLLNEKVGPKDWHLLGAAAFSISFDRTDQSSVVMRNKDGVEWDEGGFGKGAAIDRALRAVEGQNAQVVINFGGQLAVSPGSKSRFRFGEQMLLIDGGSVSTSGQDHQPAHILDPGTGLPARDFGQLAVWTRSALRSDCLSTGLYVMGPRRAFQWSLRHPEVHLILSSGSDVYASCSLKKQFVGRASVHFICRESDISNAFKESV